jgi:ABC-type glycerol-3-phosphate transport system substrate-binding protein
MSERTAINLASPFAADPGVTRALKVFTANTGVAVAAASEPGGGDARLDSAGALAAGDPRGWGAFGLEPTAVDAWLEVALPPPDRRAFVPLRVDFPVLYYRADLLEDRREQRWFQEATGRELAAPGNWGLLAAAAQYFTRPPQLYGFAFPGDPAGLLAFFLQVVASLGGTPADRHGRPQLLSREAAAAASLLYDLHVRWQATPPETLAMDQAAVSARFRRGELAMALDGPTGFQRVLDPTYSAVGGWLGLARVPGAPPPRRRSLPTLLALSLPLTGAAAPALGELARYLLSDAGQEALCSDGGLPVTSAAAARQAAALRPGAIAHRRWQLWEAARAELPAPLPLLDPRRWEAELGGRLRRMLEDALDPPTILREAQDSLAGVERIRRD